MSRPIPDWANKRKLAVGMAAEDRACAMFQRMYPDVYVDRQEWDCIIDAKIYRLIEGEVFGHECGYVEVKSHKAPMAQVVMKHHKDGLYGIKKRQYDFAYRNSRLGRKTVLMVEFDNQWFHIPDLGSIIVRDEAVSHWRNEINEKRDTPMVYVDPRKFEVFPSTPGAYFPTRIAGYREVFSNTMSNT